MDEHEVTILRIARFVILLTIFSSTKCGIDELPSSSTIVNGELATDDDFKFIVSIGFEGYKPHAGGTIIDKKWILTARHTIIHTITDEKTRYFNFSQPPVDKPIRVQPKYDNNLDKSYVHPGYRPEKMFCYPVSDDKPVFATDSDLGLIKLKDPIPLGKKSIFNFSKIDINKEFLDYTKGITIQIAGWGRTIPDNVRTDMRLRKAKILSQDPKKHKLSAAYKPYQQICIFKQDQSACNGDSGGPAVITNPSNGKSFLAGVLSYNAQPNCRAPTILQNAYFFKEWIEKIMKKDKKYDKYLCQNLIGKEYNRP